MRKSEQIANVCSSQIVVKIGGVATENFVGENQRFYYSTFFVVCIVQLFVHFRNTQYSTKRYKISRMKSRV